MKVYGEADKQIYGDSRLLGYGAVSAGKCECLPQCWILGVNFFLVRNIGRYESPSQNNVTVHFEMFVVSSNKSTSP